MYEIVRGRIGADFRRAAGSDGMSVTGGNAWGQGLPHAELWSNPSDYAVLITFNSAIPADPDSPVEITFQVGTFSAKLRLEQVMGFPGADLPWINPASGLGYYYWRLLLTETGYIVGYGFDYEGSEIHLSVWKVEGINNLGPGDHTYQGYFS